MSDFTAALTASEYLPEFWPILLYPIVPVMAYVIVRWHLQRKGRATIGSFWGTTAFVSACAWTPAFAMLAFCAASQGEVEALSQAMDAIKVSHAYDSLCRFSADHRGPRDVDWATNVLRDHVLWADVKPGLGASMAPRRPLPANEPITCNRTPFADTNESQERYANLKVLQGYVFGGFIITALGSVWGSFVLLLPRKKRQQADEKEATSVLEGAGPA